MARVLDEGLSPNYGFSWKALRRKGSSRSVNRGLFMAVIDVYNTEEKISR
jgi:hypothetical protein